MILDIFIYINQEPSNVIRISKSQLRDAREGAYDVDLVVLCSLFLFRFLLLVTETEEVKTQQLKRGGNMRNTQQITREEDIDSFRQKLEQKESESILSDQQVEVLAEEADINIRKETELIKNASDLYCRTIDERTPSECSAYLKDAGKDLWVVIRKLAENKKAMLFIELLAGNPEGMSFGELKKKTGMDSNDINHTLLGLKNLGLVIQDEENKKYSITMYCAAFLATFSRLNTALKWLNECSKSGKKKKYSGESTAAETASAESQ